MKFKHFITGLISGIVFVGACGQHARTLADGVISAISVTFDNSGTGLSSTNVQDAIAELASSTGQIVDPHYQLKDRSGAIIWEAPHQELCGTGAVYNPDPANRPRIGYNPAMDSCLVFIPVVYRFYGGPSCSGNPIIAMPFTDIPSAGSALNQGEPINQTSLTKPIIYLMADCIWNSACTNPRKLTSAPPVQNWISTSWSTRKANGTCVGASVTNNTLTGFAETSAPTTPISGLPFAYPFTTGLNWVLAP